MIIRIYSVRDASADAYLPIFTRPSDKLAIRDFSELCRDPGHTFRRHPTDFTLHCVGSFDDSNGSLVSFDTGEILASASDYAGDAPFLPMFPDQDQANGKR